jgi:hypothetical protein
MVPLYGIHDAVGYKPAMQDESPTRQERGIHDEVLAEDMKNRQKQNHAIVFGKPRMMHGRPRVGATLP